jgi:hypothetical protein
MSASASADCHANFCDKLKSICVISELTIEIEVTMAWRQVIDIKPLC